MTKSQPKKPDGEASGSYKVGFGKPPKHTRFKKGQSGNPKGRLKGGRNFKSDVRDTLTASVKVTRNGKPQNVSTQQAALLRLREKALGGDPRALDQLLRLAQVFNNEERAEQTGISSNDAVLLQVYRARVLSGAAEQADADEGLEERSNDAPSCLSDAGNVVVSDAPPATGETPDDEDDK